MLVLTRTPGDRIRIGDTITVTVLEVRGDHVRIGIDAPRDVTVHRDEVWVAIAAETAAAAGGDSDAVLTLLRGRSPDPDGTHDPVDRG